MAGYSMIYVIGGDGYDGVNPIDMMILVGEGNRQWMEPHYVDETIRPMANLKTIIPASPDDPNSLIDACIAFFPKNFESCAHYPEVVEKLQEMELLDFDLDADKVPKMWGLLREEARQIFSTMHVWRGAFERINPPTNPE